MVTNCRMGAGVGHRELPQTKGCQNLINIQTKAVITANNKRFELRMSGVHFDSVEPKVLHVLCHCYAAINIFIFNVLITFSYIL